MRFLVIDEQSRDQEDVTRLIIDSFDDAVVTVAVDPDAYEQALGDIPPNVVFTENRLGWTDGLAVLHKVQQHWLGVPVIMVTGSGSEALAVEALRAGFADYIAKRDLERLPEAVRASLRSTEMADRPAADVDASALSQHYAASLIHAFPEGAVLCNPAGKVVEMNEIAERLLGYSSVSRDRPLTRQLRQVLAWWANGKPLRDGGLLPHARALRGETMDAVVLSWLPGGHHERRWYSTRAAAIRRSNDQVVAALWTFTDVTDLITRRAADKDSLEASAEEMASFATELEVQAEELLAQNEELRLLRGNLEKRIDERTAELELSNQTNRLLVQEIDHRVKNTLTAILGLIMAEQDRPPAEAEHQGGGGSAMHLQHQASLHTLSERVRSLATVHAMLSANEWHPLPVNLLVRDVVQASADAFEGKLDLEIVGRPIYVTPTQAHNLALVVGELTTNAIKYGRREEGLGIHVDIWLEGGQVCITYRNRGPGYPETVLSGEGRSVGLGLVGKIMTHSLRGTWQLRNNDGAVTELRFPADIGLNEGVA